MFFSDVTFLQLLYINVFTLHALVLKADAYVIDGYDGMLFVTVLVSTHHAEVKVELYGLPCHLRPCIHLSFQ